MNRNTFGLIASITLLFAGYYAASLYFMNEQGSPETSEQFLDEANAPSPLQDAAGLQTPDTPLPTTSLAEPEGAPQAVTDMQAGTEKAPGRTAADAPPFEDTPPVDQEFATETGLPSASLETADLAIRMDSRGGCLEEIVLKKYASEKNGARHVDVVQKLEPCKALGIKVGRADLREQPALISQPQPHELVAEQLVGGISIRRTIKLDDEKSPYMGRFRLEVRNVSDQPLTQLVELEAGATSSHSESSSFLSFDQSRVKKVSYLMADELEEEILPFESKPSSEVLMLEPQLFPQWIATGSTYFQFALIPEFRESLGLRVERQPFNMQPNRQSPAERTIYEAWVQHSVTLNPGEKTSYDYRVYMGPKSIDTLKEAGYNLDSAVNFGFFRIIAWPMFKVLGFFEAWMGNWGLAIIALTLLVRALFLPLTAKSYAASKKMQKMQPKMNELREKYKDDKQKQQQELMALMSKEGVNPLGGCLPILPQIPVFFGLNSVLMNTFELRQAPFYFWLQDLSAKDPYYVTPVLMAILMFVQQKMIPMPSMDPNQARMMRFLPIVFALFMISYPSGLVLYIITSTVFSMVQQQFMMRRYKDA